MPTLYRLLLFRTLYPLLLFRISWVIASWKNSKVESEGGINIDLSSFFETYEDHSLNLICVCLFVFRFNVPDAKQCLDFF